MKKALKLSILLLTLTSLILAAPAMAQVENEPPETIKYLPVTVIDCKDAKIVGEIVKPSTVYGVAKQEAEFDSQIRVRKNFLPEVMVTASFL